MRKDNKNPQAIIPLVEGNGEPKGIEGWALLELFGHQRIVGKVSTQVVGVAALIRVDVPDLTKDGKIVRRGFTRFYGPGAIYSITPVDEEGVRQMLPFISGAPIKEWEYRFSRSSDYDEES